MSWLDNKLLKALVLLRDAPPGADGPEAPSCPETSSPERLCAAPVASVVMITHNHDRWIARAIEGVLMQQTDFPFELVISEDCSADNTRAIALDFQARHPGVIRVILPSHNLGCEKNLLLAIRKTRGEFVAFCEGDDYWTAPDKLQKQVALLRNHPECSLCAARAEAHDFRNGTRHFMPDDDRPFFRFEDFLYRHPVHTSTYLCRRKALLDIVAAHSPRITIMDHTLCQMLADSAPAVFLPETVSVHQMTGEGVWSHGDIGKSRRLTERITIEMCLFYGKERRPALLQFLTFLYLMWAVSSIKNFMAFPVRYLLFPAYIFLRHPATALCAFAKLFPFYARALFRHTRTRA